MEFEDSRNALFCDPNAYIQRFEKKKCEPKKVIFSEPYESLPNFYINNNLKKGNCDCISKPKQEKRCKHHDECKQHHNDKCHNNASNQSGFGFDIKSLLPLLGLFNKGGGADLSSVVGLLNNVGGNTQSGSNNNPLSLISSLMSNKDAMSGILNLFKGGLNIFNKKQPVKKELITTDFEIKNYTRVE